MHSPPVFVVTTAKGGAGKTTIAVNLAHAIARIELGTRRLKVLFFDLDAQGNATRLLGFKKDEFPVAGSVKQVLDGGVAKPIVHFDIHCVGYNAEAAAQFQLLATPIAMRTFFKGLRATIAAEQPDAVVIDTPPIETPAGGVGCMAATHVVIPLQPHPDALEGAMQTRRYIPDLSDAAQRPIRLCGVVPIMNFRCKAVDGIMAKAQEEFGDLLTDSIPLRSVIIEAATVGMPIVAYEENWIADNSADQSFLGNQRKRKYSEVGQMFDKVAMQLLARANREVPEV